MSGTDNDSYLSVVYNLQDKPITAYPYQLARYLVDRFSMSKDASFLDLGCGRGDFLRGFLRCGLQCYGVDHSLSARELCPDAQITSSDLLVEPLPYDDNFFDYIFSKSVIEHFYYPEKLVNEIFRILKPGGLVVAMTPDWESQHRIFYHDFTHRHPFTVISLRDIFLINGFTDVVSEKFYQLPFLWDSPWLTPGVKGLACLAPESWKRYSKLVRFAKDVMLLGSARKPLLSI